MIKTITPNDLVKYVYHEAPEDTKEIDFALLCDSLLLEEYQQIVETASLLDQAQIEPPAEVIDRILEYAKKPSY